MVKRRTQLYNDLAVFIGGVQLYVRDLQNVNTLTVHSSTSPWTNNMFVKTSWFSLSAICKSCFFSFPSRLWLRWSRLSIKTFKNLYINIIFVSFQHLLGKFLFPGHCLLFIYRSAAWPITLSPFFLTYLRIHCVFCVGLGDMLLY